MTKEALAVLEITKRDAVILPCYRWRPPDKNMIKINTDGGLSMKARKGGARGVSRSSAAYLRAWSKPYSGNIDPLISEALALRDGVTFAKQRGYPDVVMETDCVERHGSETSSTRIRRASW
jgi:hypothetical protein